MKSERQAVHRPPGPEKTDYRTYRLSPTQTAKYLGFGCVLFLAVDYLFYQSLLLSLLALPFSFFTLRFHKTRLILKRRQDLNRQFRDALGSLNVAVQAGYSIENAVVACTRDLERLYPPQADILIEFHYLENQLYLSVPIEDLFLDLGARTGIEDIENFAAVFNSAKRTGGDMSDIIQKTARMLSDKIDVRTQIDASLAAKKHEQTIMSLMPAGIILYMRLTSPGFLDVLYGSAFGIAAMSVCLAVYLAAFWLGVRITDISV